MSLCTFSNCGSYILLCESQMVKRYMKFGDVLHTFVYCDSNKLHVPLFIYFTMF